MKVKPLEDAVIREAASRALGEDRGPADVTSLATLEPNAMGRAYIFCKEDHAILCGVTIAERVFMEADHSLSLERIKDDGDSLSRGDRVLNISGSLRSILTGERTALNFIQQLSGVSTKTREFVDAVRGTKTQILDTRKTIPGLRHIQKYAVACGGGVNHRMGLYDAFMIKDNHIAAHSGGPEAIRKCVRKAREFDPELPLVVEADHLDQVELLIELGVPHILLDNMDNDTMREAVRMAAGKSKLEASGNISIERARSVAETGVDYISVGALTHSIRAVDFSLEVELEIS